ncbi:MAG: hypothetical protein GY696_15120 [Gammaproteobacteria bacterium]|nr:hypothetical protein [Gammaproteobacteria bacterium]
MSKSIISALIFTILFTTTTISFAANMSGQEIEQAFSGNTADWVSLKRKPTAPRWQPPYGRTYFSPDGKLEGVRKGKPRSGTWRIENNQLCQNWKKEKCRSIESDGNGGYFISNPENGKRGVHIKKIEQGKIL